jgi:hypothetical protein
MNKAQLDLKLNQNDIIDMLIQEEVDRLEEQKKAINDKINQKEKERLRECEIRAKIAEDIHSEKISRIKKAFPNLELFTFDCSEPNRTEHHSFIFYFIKKDNYERTKGNIIHTFNYHPINIIRHIELKYNRFIFPFGGFGGFGGYDELSSYDIYNIIDVEFEFSTTIRKNILEKHPLMIQYNELNDSINSLYNKRNVLYDKISDTKRNKDRFKAKITKLILSNTEKGRKFLEKIEQLNSNLKLNK